MELQIDQYKTAYVSFSAEINVTTCEHLVATCMNLVRDGFNELYFLFSTPGGSVMHGMNIYNVLRALPARLVFHNVGNVDSIGNAIFLAGDIRLACPHSTFMFHGVGMDIPSGVRLEQKNSQEILEGILADQTRIASILTEHTALDAADARDLFKEARTKDAAYALANRIISDIRDVDIPMGAATFSFVFQR